MVFQYCKIINTVTEESLNFCKNNTKDLATAGEIAADALTTLAIFSKKITEITKHKLPIELAKFSHTFKILSPLTSFLEFSYKTLKVFQIIIFSKEHSYYKSSKKIYYTVFLPQIYENKKNADDYLKNIQIDLTIRKFINLIISITFLFFTIIEFSEWLLDNKIYINPYFFSFSIIGNLLLCFCSSLEIFKSFFKINQKCKKLKMQNALERKKLYIEISYHSFEISKNTLYFILGIITTLGIYFKITKNPLYIISIFLSSSTIFLITLAQELGTSIKKHLK